MSAVTLKGRLICRTEEEAATVRRFLPRHIELTRAEPGCLAFDVEPTADPLVWVVAEVFADRHAFEAHQARSWASEWSRATADIPRDYVVESADGA